MRLDRLLSERARISRRAAAVAIRSGRVTVAGELADSVDHETDREAEIAIDGALVVSAPRVAVFHKPLGVHSTTRDEWGRACLGTAAAELLALGLHPVGRLDADTDGLLLFSGDGPLTQYLLHPRRAIERTYVAGVAGAIDPTLPERLAAGIPTADGTFSARVREIVGDQVTLTVTEGKHRMVRRMLANAGHPVVTLRRLAYGPFQLGTLAPGAWRPPDADERAWLEARQ